jgi:uncharacterized coiled-coil protein SlyX
MYDPPIFRRLTLSDLAPVERPPKPAPQVPAAASWDRYLPLAKAYQALAELEVHIAYKRRRLAELQHQLALERAALVELRARRRLLKQRVVRRTTKENKQMDQPIRRRRPDEAHDTTEES